MKLYSLRPTVTKSHLLAAKLRLVVRHKFWDNYDINEGYSKSRDAKANCYKSAFPTLRKFTHVRPNTQFTFYIKPTVLSWTNSADLFGAEPQNSSPIPLYATYPLICKATKTKKGKVVNIIAAIIDIEKDEIDYSFYKKIDPDNIAGGANGWKPPFEYQKFKCLDDLFYIYPVESYRHSILWNI